MMNEENKKKIVANHVFSFAGIWNIVKSRKYISQAPFWVCVAVAFAVSLLIFFNSGKSYDILMSIASCNMSIFPSLTGFSLTAFSVCVNFGNMDFAKKSVTLDGYSIYQSAIAIFAFSIFVQVITLILAYSIKISEKVPQFSVCPNLVVITNAMLGGLLIFTASFAFYLIFSIIGNIFTFGQLNNSNNTITAFKDRA